SQTTYDLAERVEKAVGPVGIAERIRELVKIISREETALKVSEEIVLGSYGSFEEEPAAEQAVRTALAVLDEAVTVAPIQGIYDVRIRRNDDRTRHLAIYFAGPMRSAGGTEMGMTMIVGDHVRRRLNLQPYKATESEARRFVEELRIYERAVARFQYRNSDTVLHDAMLRLPVEPNGVETDPVELPVNRNIPTMAPTRGGGGPCRARNTGLASVGVHPATMEILGGFLAVGVQMRTERPGKAGIVTAVDSIEPPVVRMMDGSVVRIDNPSEARAVKDRIDRILFLGDLIVGYGEFLENNRTLVPSGFVEEWWSQLLAEKMKTFEADTGVPSLSITKERLHSLDTTPLATKPS